MMASSKVLKATIYLVRHGECAANLAQVALEPFSDPLTETGRAQAELLGKCLEKVAFTRAYASDYPRTFETAQIILRQSKVAQEGLLKPEKRIRERDYTGMVGQKITVLVDTLVGIMKEGTSYLKAEMPESETVKEFEDRLIDVLQELIKDLRKSKSNEETILMVSHCLAIQRLMVLLNKRSIDFGIQNWTENIYSEKMMKNTTYHEIVLEIPRDEKASVTGHVKYAHFREHVKEENEGATKKPGDLKDVNNYTFLEVLDSEQSFEKETVQFCKPV